ncbi:hypothetical protein JCM11641_004741 [Rhodosporidiobolus odoratus]
MPLKATKAKDTASSDPSHVYSVGDIVLAKIKGYPAWPGHILDHDDANPKVKKEKPKTKNIYLVQFFPTGDFSWTRPADLSLLTPKEIEAYISSPSKKKGDLLAGYKIAQDPSGWVQDKADQQAEYDEAMAQLEAAQGEDEDMLDDEEDAGKGKKGDKKRKRASEAGAKKDDNKPKKLKAEGKGKKAAAKKSNEDDEAPSSKKARTSEDPGADTVKSWRHKLQKVFLGKAAPAADEMPKCAEYFDAMESFEMKKEWLQESKLAKVLKRIALMKDDQIPEEDKYSFRERSSQLASKWASLLGGTEGSPKPDEETPAENGNDAGGDEVKENGEEEDKKEEPAEEKKEENGEAAPAEEAPAPKKEEEEKKKEEAAPAAEESA